MATGTHEFVHVGPPGVIVSSLLAMGVNAGAGWLGKLIASNLPSILTLIGTLTIAGATVWRSYNDRDKRRYQARIAELERMVKAQGTKP